MKGIVAAIVVLAVGALLLPPVKEMTLGLTAQFGVEGLSPFEELLVSFWPLLPLIAILYGAVMLIGRRRS